MSNPTILSVIPAPNSTDIVLGSSIVVTFSTPIETDSFNNSTFVLTSPNATSLLTEEQLANATPIPTVGRGYILGTFAFTTPSLQRWVAVTPYIAGAQVVDSVGNIQTVIEAGLSAPYEPAWLTTTGDSTIDNNIPTWLPLTPNPFSQFILDSNANIQKVTNSGGGTTGAGPNPPTWNTVLNGVTFDGGITWTNYGPLTPIVWMNNGAYNSGGTIATFTPSTSMISGTTYTVLVVGADSALASNFVHDSLGNELLNSYQWSFTTGTLDIVTPPIQNPVSGPAYGVVPYIDPNTIQVIPRSPVGVGDPSVSNMSVIELIFPAPINPNSFDPTQVLIGIEPIMNDPDVMVPPNASASYIIQGNKLIVTLVGV